MNKKATTKDELFLVKLYQIASSSGEYAKAIDRYEIGRAIGQNDKGIDTIVNLLAQANFVKKSDGSFVSLTKNGLELVSQLLSPALSLQVIKLG